MNYGIIALTYYLRLLLNPSCLSIEKVKKPIKWQFRVHKADGRLSDHYFNFVDTDKPVSKEVSDCLIQVLDSRPYDRGLLASQIELESLVFMLVLN